MKNGIKVFTLAFAMCATVACSKNDEPAVMPQQDYVLGFAAEEVINHIDESRASLIGSKSDLCQDGASFGCYGEYTSADGKTTVNVFSTKLQAVTYSSATSSWNYSPVCYWHKTGTYKFRAYYPSTADIVSSATADVFSISYSIYTSQYDLMVAYKERDMALWGTDARNGASVGMSFQHALSAVRFRIGTDGCSTNNLREVHLRNLTSVGVLVYTVPDGEKVTTADWQKVYYDNTTNLYSWSGDTVIPTVSGKFINMYSGTGYDERGAIMAIPQTIAANTALLTFTTGEGATAVTVSRPIPAITWQAGKLYTYNITITGSEIDIEVVTSDWTHIDASADIVIE